MKKLIAFIIVCAFILGTKTVVSNAQIAGEIYPPPIISQ